MKKLIAANWKMNKTAAEAVSTADELKKLAGKEKNADVVICPSFTSLQSVAKELEGSNIKLGAQNMHFEDSGAYTGDISPLMLKDTGCEYVILGHSERRQYLNETDQMVHQKIKMALATFICNLAKAQVVGFISSPTRLQQAGINVGAIQKTHSCEGST